MMLHSKRSGELLNPSFITRRNRLRHSDDGYYYKSRECDLVGPFGTESEALYDLNVFIEVIKIEQEMQLDDLKLAV